ncbi:MAG TPA: type II secretion system F family protein [Candidatus Xenobia bacterium]|jgi:type IV pilus assembly protein PilC
MSVSTTRRERQKLLEEALQPKDLANEFRAQVPTWQRVMRAVQGPRRIKSYNGLPVFYRALAAMFSSGIKITRGLEILSNQAEEPALAEVLPMVVQNLWEGMPLSAAMKPFHLLFPPFHIKLLEMGEASGKLPKVLLQIADYEERRGQIFMKVKSAMTYPAFLFSVSMIVVVLGPPYMFGGLLKFIQDSHQEVPLMTRMLLDFSAFVTSPWFFLGLGIAGYGILRVVRYFQSHEAARRELVINMLRLPIIGRTIQLVAVCRFARSLATTLEVGLGILHCLIMSAESSDNPVLVEKMKAGLEDLKNGKMLNEVLADSNFFPRAFIAVVKVGEETGEIGEIVKRMAEMYETEMEEQLNAMLALMEPLWMMVMGLMVGFIAVATLMPIMAMLRNL